MAQEWSELPQELLAQVFARIFFPVDRARFNAVCRSWRSDTSPPGRQLPWIMLPCGGFLNPSDRVMRRLVSFPKPETRSRRTYRERSHNSRFSFPRNTRCIGSTNSWIAIDCAGAENRHKYLLHNEFSRTTLSLPELDDAIGHVSKLFKIRKVLLQSTPDDVIALMTNHRSCPIILTRIGKGVWFPKSYATPLIGIIDVVFLGNRLYGITKDEQLVFLDIVFDDYGVPMVTGGKCVIGEDFDVWSNEEDYDDEDDIDDDDHDEEEDDDDHGDYDEDDDSSDCENEYDNNDDVVVVVADDDDVDHCDEDEDDDKSDIEDAYKNGDDIDGQDETENDYEDTYDLTNMTDEDITLEAFQCRFVDDSPHEIKPIIYNMWYLMESGGKLLMVRREVHYRGFLFNHKVEVLEADISSAMWVPVKGGLGGRALFISRRFCKSVSAACSKEIQEDAIYFIDTDEVFSMRSETLSTPRDDLDYKRTLRCGDTEELTWVFPPELVS